MNDDKEIVTKEIRGITAKTLIWIMGGFGSVIITVMTTYFSIVQKIDKTTIYTESVQNDMGITKQKVENNAADIRDIKQHDLPSLDNRMSIMEEKMKDKIFIKSVP